MAQEISHDPAAQRYILSIDGERVSVLDYRDNGSAISIVHTFTQPEQRGRGLAAELTEFAVTDIEKRSELPIVPACPFVGQWFEEHPERAGLLSR